MNRTHSLVSEAAMRRLLGVSVEADLAQIKTAFRKKIKQLHPDRCPGAGSSRVVDRLIEAYSGLSSLYSSGSGATTARGSSSLTDVFAIGELAVASTDPLVRRSAVEALARSGRKTAYAYLRQALADRDQSVVKAAVVAVAELRIIQSGGELSVLFAGADSSLRVAVVRAFAILGHAAPGWNAVKKIALECDDLAVKRYVEQLNSRFSSNVHQAARRMA